MLFYANLTKSVDEIRKFCLILISCQNRTEQNMKSMSMKWDQIFFCKMRQNQIFILWNETESNSYFVRWDRIKFSFCEMRWDWIFFCEMRWNERWEQFLWDETESLWNRTSHSDSSVSLTMTADIWEIVQDCETQIQKFVESNIEFFSLTSAAAAAVITHSQLQAADSQATVAEDS